MRITYGTTELAGFMGDSVSNFSAQGAKAIEVGEAIRAEYARPRDRGNRRREVSFTARQEYASVGAAETAIAFAVGELETLEGATARPLRFEPEGSGTPFFLHDAVMQPAQIRQIGIALLFTHRFIGSRWSYENPLNT